MFVRARKQDELPSSLKRETILQNASVLYRDDLVRRKFQETRRGLAIKMEE